FRIPVEAKAGSPIIVVGVDDIRAYALPREYDFLQLRIEEKTVVVDFDGRSREFIPKSNVDGEVRQDAPIVLQIPAIKCAAHVLLAISHGPSGAGRYSEQEVGQARAQGSL